MASKRQINIVVKRYTTNYWVVKITEWDSFGFFTGRTTMPYFKLRRDAWWAAQTLADIYRTTDCNVTLDFSGKH